MSSKKKHSEKTYFDYARWVTFNGYKFKISKGCWVKEGENGKTYTDKEVFKIFIGESNPDQSSSL